MANEVDIAGVTTAVFNLLKPLVSEDRQKVVQAALTLLGEASSQPKALRGEALSESHEFDGTLHPKTRLWAQKNGLNTEILSQVFHIENGSAEIIAGDIPGKSGKEKTINAYILTGAREYILKGESNFDDRSARNVCRSLGCYSDTNHATYLKDKGNLIGGSKNIGWTLTGPGLKAAADLIQVIAK